MIHADRPVVTCDTAIYSCPKPCRFAYTTGPYARQMFDEMQKRNIHADHPSRTLLSDSSQVQHSLQLHYEEFSEHRGPQYKSPAGSSIDARTLTQPNNLGHKLQDDGLKSQPHMIGMQRVLQTDQTDAGVTDINHEVLDTFMGTREIMSSNLASVAPRPAGVNLTTTSSSSGNSGYADKQQVFYAVKHFPHKDDAFHSIMQWLFAKIPDTR